MFPVLAVLAAAVLFGTTGTAQALGPADSTPWAVGAVRLTLGGAALAALAFTLGARQRRRAAAASGAAPAPRPVLDRRAVLLMATTGTCLALYQPLFFLGAERNGVAVGTVIALGSAPVIAGLVEWALTRRVPSRTWLTATTLATAGVVLLGVGGTTAAGGGGGSDPLGLLASLAAGTAFAVQANVQRRLMDAGWDPFTIGGAMGLGGAAWGVVMLFFADLAWLASPDGIAMTLWLGLATVGIAYTLFTVGLLRLTAATAATLTLAEPLTATLLGIGVLGERLSVAALIGLAVLVAGLVLLAAGSRTPRDPAPYALEG
ncbi:DMT family transporter [Microbacterium sp. zg.Y1090]|uniref:DMT family transporter n=1 Tax=Microbacterium TaxID=33882 RepID=UPI00214AB3DC|nr:MULTISPECIES: DMT family transporter [unclassified Microbacterium]MCR2812829.1 DMT family transporter [Microbacterium sp. zg.Y1084]MCR2817369.1 DMT family transporter [Microbacterium sp. zg.Y1090]MDL5485972.1 DMT family transporter [Microbacterium sp. zg-Y1211]WIM29144.1 DMT family transporter [Microbacterium sp. zg-Y1090]